MSTFETEIRRYKPAIVLDRFLPRRVRNIVHRILFVLAVVLLLIVVFFALQTLFVQDTFTVAAVVQSAGFYAGLLLIVVGLWVAFVLFSFFYNSLYFRGIESIVRESGTRGSGITFEVARVLERAGDDVTYGFLTSPYGRNIIMRCALGDEALNGFLDSSRDRITTEMLTIPANSFLTLVHVGSYILKHDASFKEFLFSHGVREETYLGAVGWIMRIYHEVKYKERWWSRDNLGRIRGIGKEFSFGVAYELKQYIRDIRTTAIFSTLTSDTAYADDKIGQIETILARTKEANVILVGDPGVGKMDILVRLGKKMAEGESVASIEGKRLVVLDSDGFMALHNTKQKFEYSFLKMLGEAERAGNIVIVIEDLAKFFTSAATIGVDIGELMDRFLVSSHLQIIGTSDPVQYHEELERRPQFLSRFETVYIESPDLLGTLRVLQDVALRYEIKNHVTFTYPAIQAVAESAERYITEGIMPDKAVDLLVEVAPAARKEGVVFVTKEFIQKYVSTKTGIPSGPISEEERDVLLHLEDVLHERIVGQHHAIEAISSAMRRARAGIQSADRPTGSFLFLGPTGVGKTETAKTLARIFFGDEKKMLRLDMSEFTGVDGLSRLMGDGTSSGVLSDMLREHPYGVLLLDEFEKTVPEVHDLFLQILDEGAFTDARGGKVNARNAMIIATSNAGSDLIWEFVKEGKNPTQHRDEVIDTIVRTGVYKPELINRFDGTIIFEPLTSEDQRKIAGLMLEELRERIRKEGYQLTVNDALINLLTQKGYNPQFGARPMRRLLQDTIEEKIATKIIAGHLKPGDVITFDAGDFDAT